MKLAIGNDRVTVTEAVLGIHRVEVPTPDNENRSDTVGYVLEVNHLFVSLKGSVYNTSVEVGQSHDLDAAVRMLVQ